MICASANLFILCAIMVPEGRFFKVVLRNVFILAFALNSQSLACFELLVPCRERG